MPIVIVTAAMGGGHLQVSRELQRQLAGLGHDVVVADLHDLMLGPTGSWLERLYPWLVDRAPWLYELIYRTFFRARQRHGERGAIPVRLALPGLRRLLRRAHPDVVVSTYHLAALAVARLRAAGALPCPAVTFITTFSVHNLWIHPAADLQLCISAEAAAEATRRSGCPSAVCGPVVRPEFADPPPAWTRAGLGVDGDARVALVVGGSQGMGSAERAASAIAFVPGWVPVVVCGHNEQLRRRVERLGSAVALGWVQDMAGLMAAADVLVDNAGGLSAKEALRVGLPVVTFEPIAGHGRDDAEGSARLGTTEIVSGRAGLAAALDRAVRERERRIARGKALYCGDAAAMIDRVARGLRVTPSP